MLLRSLNIVPDAVVGHSSGEIAAAYCAGGLSRESAWKTAYFRGVLAAKLDVELRNTNQSGAMMAVGLSEADLAPYLDDQSDAIDVGCVNGTRLR